MKDINYKAIAKDQAKIDELMQKRCNKLIEREVYCHVGGLIDEIQEAYAKNGSYFEWQEAFTCEPTDKQIADYIADNTTDDYDTAEEVARVVLEYPEIYEYWAVSSWLADKLKEHGEPVAEFGLTHVWGRGTTGQAIALDYVIEQIVKDTNYGKWLKSV